MREYDLSDARWRKSSYSDHNGGSCIEVADHFPGAAAWRKSTYSDQNGGSCVEVSDNFPGLVPIRDSKAGADGPVVAVPASAWSAFIGAVKNARFTTA
ncbi:DUF397 domain-containing protein [Streptomyces lydicus]|uniref:DUF397 domain-containing protein n=1 Tax=Streptomyces lydicus TaxID=47763 RepID=A0A1D7VGS6_9ACTN|nr:DUF397 domain-containing protein [Streptomyces lydicus]AOP45929.1 DUF397 domain-containing protein [Streptomyces lydicus]